MDQCSLSLVVESNRSPTPARLISCPASALLLHSTLSGLDRTPYWSRPGLDKSLDQISTKILLTMYYPPCSPNLSCSPELRPTPASVLSCPLGPMSAPSKSPTCTRAKATSVPDLMLDPLGLITSLGCFFFFLNLCLRSSGLCPMGDCTCKEYCMCG